MNADAALGPDWVSATRLRNYFMEDPLLDWLGLYGKQAGFTPDDEAEGYRPELDFGAFIMRKGVEFEAAVMRRLGESVQVERIAECPADSLTEAAAIATFEAMQRGVGVISQGVLRHASSRTFGMPDLLVRSDVIARLTDLPALDGQEAAVAAPRLKRPYHYRVVDIKFTTLHLSKFFELDNSGSAPCYKAQVALYTRALAELQGYDPQRAYLLGRRWTKSKERGAACFDRLAPISITPEMLRRADAACDWLRLVRTEGASWRVLPTPTCEELRPNMGNDQDAPWHGAKRQIAEETGEWTQIWQVGVEKRNNMVARGGLSDWRTCSCTAIELGFGENSTYTPVLQAVLDINRSTDGPSVRPAHISAAREVWHTPAAVEFYVDFEFASDLNDDFSAIPMCGGQALIYMIGCGHLEDGEWRFRVFTVDRYSEKCEREVIFAWLDHMEVVRARLAPKVAEPLVFHWSAAEKSSLTTAYNAAAARHSDANWPSPKWFDFLTCVMKAEPVVVRGALKFGLKAVCNAMHKLGLVETIWAAGPVDGLGAMLGGWWCDERAGERDVTLNSLMEDALDDSDEATLIRQIRDYNEVDCRSMMEIIRYLRANH